MALKNHNHRKFSKISGVRGPTIPHLNPPLAMAPFDTPTYDLNYKCYGYFFFFHHLFFFIKENNI